MRVMNGFLENRKPSPWAHEAETRNAAGKMLFSEGPRKWGSDAFTLREGVTQGKPARYGGGGDLETNSVANNREPREYLFSLKIHQV